MRKVWGGGSFGTHWLSVYGQTFIRIPFLHSAKESKSCRFKMPWGWVNVLGELFFYSQSQCQKQDCAPVHIYTHLFDCTDLWAKISPVQFNKHFMSPCAPLNSVGIENHFTREPTNKQIPPPPFCSSLFCFANEFLSLQWLESSVGALWPQTLKLFVFTVFFFYYLFF